MQPSPAESPGTIKNQIDAGPTDAIWVGQVGQSPFHGQKLDENEKHG